MAEVTLSPKAAAEALNVSTWTLGYQLRKAAVGQIEALARNLSERSRDRDSKLEYLDEMVEEARRLLEAAEACEVDWHSDLGTA